MTVPFNLSELATGSPYAVLARLRDEDPVHWSADLKAWIVTRFADVKEVLENEEIYSASRMRPFFDSLDPVRAERVKTLRQYVPLWIVFQTAPDHTRLRRVMRAPLAQKAMNGLRDNVAGIVDSLIDEFIAQGSVELMNQFSLRLPGYVILDMLGAPRGDLVELTHLTNELQLFLGQAQGVPERYARAEQAAEKMGEYFERLVALKRAGPGPDLTTMLIEASDQGDLNQDELIAYCMLIFFGGQETTANLVSNGLIALMRNRDQLDKLRAHPELARSAVAECLRYDGPIGAVVRVVSRDHELGGKSLRKGERVFAMVNAANRDPAQFADPDRFDIERSGNRHLTFGQGAHFCLGAPLAGLEAEIALSKLVTRLDRVEPADGELAWRDGLNMRGPVTLPLTFTPAARRSAKPLAGRDFVQQQNGVP